MKPHTQKFLQQRKFYMVLPFLILPFITVLFWVLGGGEGTRANATSVKQGGLNVHLPDARFDKREIWDKLSLYEKAESDSMKFKQARENDPYFDLVAFETSHSTHDQEKASDNLIQQFPQKQKAIIDPNEEKVNQKLSELYREINKASGQPSVKAQSEQSNTAESKPSADPQFTQDVDRLEKLMEMMKESGTEGDPEMEQIENVLDKILDIQHPGRVKEKQMLDHTDLATTLPVKSASEDNTVSMMANRNRISADAFAQHNSADSTQSIAFTPFVQNGFFGLDEEVNLSDQPANGLQAVIHDTQDLVAGATVKMRVVEDIEIKGIRIPKDELIYGTCSINGERLSIDINSVRYGNSILPVSLKVYDLDGLEGIYIPGAITRDAAKKASDDALQSMQLMSLDPSLEAQAASAGIEAAKGLFSKKAKLIKITVKAGYRILLVDPSART